MRKIHNLRSYRKSSLFLCNQIKAVSTFWVSDKSNKAHKSKNFFKLPIDTKRGETFPAFSAAAEVAVGGVAVSHTFKFNILPSSLSCSFLNGQGLGQRIEYFIKKNYDKVSLVDFQMSLVRDHMLLSLLHKFFLKKGHLIHLERQEHVWKSCQLLTKNADINFCRVYLLLGEDQFHTCPAYFSLTFEI